MLFNQLFIGNYKPMCAFFHAGVRDFICETCGKSFKRKNHLEVHRRTHTGETPLQWVQWNICHIHGNTCRFTSVFLKPVFTDVRYVGISVDSERHSTGTWGNTRLKRISTTRVNTAANASRNSTASSSTNSRAIQTNSPPERHLQKKLWNVLLKLWNKVFI